MRSDDWDVEVAELIGTTPINNDVKVMMMRGGELAWIPHEDWGFIPAMKRGENVALPSHGVNSSTTAAMAVRKPRGRGSSYDALRVLRWVWDTTGGQCASGGRRSWQGLRGRHGDPG